MLCLRFQAALITDISKWWEIIELKISNTLILFRKNAKHTAMHFKALKSFAASIRAQLVKS